ncbi:hypothetical protein AAFF_G00409820 [Aldrovandia affinis]|uniref:Nerve growth factor-related domain-containing protein n=1 Tax=Aldrovandia affinis TaxID=143900 RepID=A0AAD7SBI3_9TELE|nr:hypothetical protein AAFF_G00409820 [Aldrovandia affinis]
MRSTTLALLFLISVQAVLNMRGGARGRGTSGQHCAQSGSQGEQLLLNTTPTNSDPKLFNTIPHSNSTDDSKLTPTKSPSSILMTDPKLFNTTPFSNPTPEPTLSNESPRALPATNPQLLIELPDFIPTVDAKVFNKRHYRSPRVLFSVNPPDVEVGGPRVRRRAGQPRHRGVYSVCDSISNWVGNKTKAIDITGNEVTVLPDVRINNIVKKQYFFETTCYGARRPSPSGESSCLGIDSRHWNSYCTNTHTFVLAMTSSKSLVAWRLIRINAACVCVLSRKSWRH